MTTSILLIAAVGVPLAMLLACVVSAIRERMPPLLGLAPIPALAAALFADDTLLVLGNARFALSFALDEPGRMLLLVAAILWSAAGAYAATGLRGAVHAGGLVVCWLMTLTGCIGAFLAADLVGFYFLLAVLSVGASGLVLQGGTAEALRASAVYLGLALIAEAFLLAGLVLLAMATPDGSLLIRDAAAAIPASPWRDLTLVLLIVGLGMKAGLVPLHFWMPLAYGAAPIPAAAVMSGAVVKASALALIRFLPLDVALPDFGLPLATIGLFGAFYGVVIGITQSRPKIVLAYSSVSQMGFLVAVIGMGLAAGDAGAARVASFYAAHHLLVKGALFLAAGMIVTTGGRRLWWVLALAAILALGIGGLPLTGGALAKLAVKPVLEDGLVKLLATLSAIGTTLLMLHFLHRLLASASPDPSASAPVGWVLSWMFMFVAALVVPWMLYSATGIGTWSDALQPKILWAALWPLLIGAGLALGLWRWGRYLPRVPEGDIVVAGQPAMRVIVRWGDALERVEGVLRQWPVAGLSLLTLILILGGAMFFDGH
ncbi:MAG: proton-conducting transporter membrane subunit [Candidatus Competibacter sp.]|nr:proton-conducting transporter membrane subunit [Candidatus Competibacter sp.]